MLVWLCDGDVVWCEIVVEGIESMLDVFCVLFIGGNIGKMFVCFG